MKENLTIREFTTIDKPSLLQLLKLNVPKYFDTTEISDYESYLDNEIENYFVAELKGEIVGAGGINYENNYTIGKISWDLINPKYHGLGFGEKLLKHRIEFLNSIKSITEISVRTSQLAYKFYEKNGFILIEIKKDFWAK